MIDCILEWVSACGCVGFFLGGLVLVWCLKMLDNELKKSPG